MPKKYFFCFFDKLTKFESSDKKCYLKEIICLLLEIYFLFWATHQKWFTGFSFFLGNLSWKELVIFLIYCQGHKSLMLHFEVFLSLSGKLIERQKKKLYWLLVRKTVTTFHTLNKQTQRPGGFEIFMFSFIDLLFCNWPVAYIRINTKYFLRWCKLSKCNHHAHKRLFTIIIFTIKRRCLQNLNPFQFDVENEMWNAISDLYN